MSAKQIFLEQYAKLPVLVDQNTCSGKTYIVTGGNTGLGLETARHLVRGSASRVILAVRNKALGEKAKADIERTTGRKSVLEVWNLDLASSASVKEFASKAAKELNRIDALVENAGVFLDSWSLAEGFETSMTVNVINTMFLGVLMMPQLIESAKKYGIQPRIVFLVSGLGFQAAAKGEMAKAGQSSIFQGTNNQKEQNMNARYAFTKLVEIYAVRAFADIYPFDKTNVTINMVSPGICTTGLARDAGRGIRVAQGVVRSIVARTPEQGSRTILHALFTDEATHGKHLSGCQVKDYWVQPWMTDVEGQRKQKQIWKELVALMETRQPGSVPNVV